MRAYIKEIYSIENKSMMEMYDAYYSAKDNMDETSQKRLYEALCGVVRSQLNTENVLGIGKVKDKEKSIVAVFDHKYEKGNYYTVFKDEEGKQYIEI